MINGLYRLDSNKGPINITSLNFINIPSNIRLFPKRG